jgi:hypothetical protein
VIRRDYLLRLIEQAVRLLQAVFGLVDLRRYPEALAMLNEGYRQFFGMDSDTLMRLPLPFLRKEFGDDAEGIALMAALLEAEGDVLTLMGNEPAALARWERALNILLDAHAEKWFAAPADLPTTVETLAERLRAYTLPADLSARLFRHFAAAGECARAETYLWEWVESAEHGGGQQEVKSYYERLLALDDAALLAGGLTRTEVEEGYRAFTEPGAEK